MTGAKTGHSLISSMVQSKPQFFGFADIYREHCFEMTCNAAAPRSPGRGAPPATRTAAVDSTETDRHANAMQAAFDLPCALGAMESRVRLTKQTKQGRANSGFFRRRAPNAT